MKSIEINSVDELPDAADMIIEQTDSRNIVAFYGPMGAGKTSLIREICARLGVEDTVTSPTFALVNQYLAGNGNTIYHFDFYRIDDPREAFDLGYEEYFYCGDLCLVEWPEKIEELLPDDTMKVRIEIADEDSRIITIE